jgi:hypothetical protein
MRIVGPNNFKGAAFVHDGKVISATRNIGPCSGWSVDRFIRMVEGRGWQIERDDLPAERSRAEPARAGDR